MKRLLVIYTGGTISMSQDATNKVVTNEENPISQHQDIINQYAEVEETHLLNVPSPHMTTKNVTRLRETIIQCVNNNVIMMAMLLLMGRIHSRKRPFY